jgi:hypothetical protein
MIMQSFGWWIGWRIAPALVVGLLLLVFGTNAVHPAFGVILGVACLAVWIWGTTIVNATWEPKLEAALASYVRDGAANLSDTGEGSPIVMTFPTGGAPLIKCAEWCAVTVFYVGEHALGISEGLRYHVKADTAYRGQGTREIYYEHINNVDLAGNTVYLALSSGGRLAYTGATGADQVATIVRSKLRGLRAANSQRTISQQMQPVVQREVHQREVVERQVVVMRCRFCKELTPAELSACKSCGAVMGGA